MAICGVIGLLYVKLGRVGELAIRIKIFFVKLSIINQFTLASEVKF